MTAQPHSPAIVEFGPRATRICAGLGTRGVAWRGRVFLAPDADAAVLAHELAHVAQQRLWRGRAVPRAWTEAEAHACGAAALAGLNIAPRLPLDPALPACWEEVGHYYTVYYVALAAGVPNEWANRLAFFTQLPDEVSELDAVRAGFSMPGQLYDIAQDEVVGPFEDAFIEIHNGFSAMGQMSLAARRDPQRSFNAFSRSLDVQRGLHALTGGDVKVETLSRLKRLQEMNPKQDLMAYGAALHVFGDSYAHRQADGATMYPTTVGHGIVTKLVEFTRWAHIPEVAAHPDAIGPHHRELYLEYGSSLYHLFRNRFPPELRVGKTLDAGTVQSNLTSIVASSNAAAEDKNEHKRQIYKLRQYAVPLTGFGMDLYAPEDQEDVPVDEFKPGTAFTVTKMDVQRALRLARDWNIPNE